MSPFESLVPPNMDVVCSYQYVNSSTLQIATTTCSNPWDYYKGYGFDIVLIALVVGLVVRLLLVKR